MPARTDAQHTLTRRHRSARWLPSVLLPLAFATAAAAQTMPAMPNPGAAPTAPPATMPAPNTGSTASAAEQTSPFVGVISGDKVYVRSGPGNNYYEVGQLTKGDLVQVTEARLGWYKILPPNGTFCLIAKDYVEPDATGQSGTVSKGDYINIRAGTALYPNRDPSNVLGTLRKGAKVTIVGSTDKYFQIAPPDNVRFYVSPQFVSKAPPETAYKVPDLKLPAGVSGPAKNTVTSVPTINPTATVELAPATGGTTPTPAATEPATVPPTDTGTVVISPTPTPAATQPVTPPQPATTFSASAYTKYQELTDSYQQELRKPPMQRNYDPLIKSFQDLSAQENIAPSVKAGSDARVAALQKLAAIQRLARDNATSNDDLNAQRKALQEQYAAAEKAIQDYEKTGPYLAEGELRTSTTVQGTYALVNPSTGRVVAYVDPSSEIDIASLTGKYIGVRGTSSIPAGTQVTVIHVRNATLLPAPESSTGGTTPSRGR